MARRAVAICLSLCGVAAPLVAQPGTASPVLIVVNQGDHNISLIDPVTRTQIATVDVGGITGHEAVASPDGKTVYVPIYGNSGVGKPGTDGDTIVAIDLESHRIVHSLTFPHGVRPHCIRYDPTSRRLFVTTELDQSISIIDPKSFTVVGSIPTGQPQSHMLVLSHDGTFGYTANVGPGNVSVLDMNSRRPIAFIPISTNTQRISISNDDRFVFTADQTKPQIAVIDTSTHAVTRRIDLPGIGYGTAPTADGRWLIVAMRQRNQLAIIDLQSWKVTRTLDVPAVPTEILVRPDGNVAYVSCTGAGKVAVIDLRDWTLQATVNAGKDADGLAWAQ